MRLSATLALPLALALTGAGVGSAVLTGTIPLELFSKTAVDPVQAPKGMEVLQTWEGDAAGLETGSLDLRTFWGPVQLVGWDEDRWVVTVFQRAQSGQAVGDRGIEATLEETGEGLGLKLLVKPTGSSRIDLEGSQGDEVAVLAQVPARIAYQMVLVCSGATEQLFGDVTGPLDQLFGEEREESQSCVGETTPGLDMSLGIGEIGPGSDDKDEVDDSLRFLVDNLHGQELVAFADYSDIGVSNARFDSASLATDYGDLAVALDGASLKAASGYGDLDIAGAIDNLIATTSYGDVSALVSGASGAIEAASEYGDVQVGVPYAPERGYDASAATEYGEAIIDLRDVEGGEEEDDGATEATEGFLPGMPEFPFGGEGKPRHKEDTIASAKSVGFDAKLVQVTISAVTEYGDVLITDGDLAEEDDDTN